MTLEERALELFPDNHPSYDWPDKDILNSAQQERRRLFVSGANYVIDEWFAGGFNEVICHDPRFIKIAEERGIVPCHVDVYKRAIRYE